MKRLLSFFAAVALLGAQSLQAQWIQTSGPHGGGVTCLAVKGLNLFAGTGGGVFRSTNNGTSWTAVNTSLPSFTTVYALAVSGSNLFVGTNNGVFLVADNGTSWTIVKTGLANLGVSSLAVQGSNLFVAGSYEHDHDDEVDEEDGVFLSADNGTSWTTVNTGLTRNTVFSLAVNGSNLFAGAYDGVFLSTNNGTGWIAVNTGLTNTLVNALAVIGSNLFAGTDGGGVFLSTNNGTSWAAGNTGLTNTSVLSLAVNGSNLFVGTYDGGVFLSINNGTSWTAVNTGLPNTNVYSLAVNGSNIFAGTNGRGVWRRPLSEMVTGVEGGFSEAPANIIVSSQLIERNRPSDAYKAENMTDGNIATAWAEGADGAGIGEWIKFGFDTPKKIKAIKILAGYAKNETVYFNNNRVKKVKVIFSEGEPQIAELKDVNEFQRLIIDRDRPTKFVKLEILEVFKGQKFDDTCISEIDFETVAGSSQILSQQITESVTADGTPFRCIPFEDSQKSLPLPRGGEVLRLKYERAGKLVKLVDNDLTIEVEFDSISSDGGWGGGFGGYGPEFSIIKRLSLAINGQEVEIPTNAYSDLANINYDRPDEFFLSRTGENYFMSMGGADAGERYAAIFMIQDHKLVRREVWWSIGGEAGRIEFK